MPSGDGDERNSNWVVTDLLDVAADFLLDFLVTSLAVWGLSGVHLVDTDDQLLDTQGVGEKGVLAGLSVLGDTGFEFTDTTSDDQDGAISLKLNKYLVFNSKIFRGQNLPGKFR